MKEMKELLERYYEGNTTLEEEKLIAAYLANNPQDAETADALLFEGISALKEEHETVPLKKSRRIAFRYFAIGGTSLAAGIALLIGLRPTNPTQPETSLPQNASAQILVTPKVSGEIKNEEQALEQARRALAFVSSKLNKGTSGINQLNQLEKSMSKIQNKKQI